MWLQNKGYFFRSIMLAYPSSNINEVIKTILNVFNQKSYNHKKAQNAYKRINVKKYS